MKNGYVKVSNALIRDTQMAPSTKRVFIAMMAYCNRQGSLRKTYEELAELSNCSVATVYHAVQDLQERQLLQKVRTYREVYGLPGKGYASNIYKLNREAYAMDHFTLVPRSLLSKAISHSTFVVALYLFAAAGRDGRAFPSIRKLAKDACLAVSTVVLALTALRKCQEFIRLHCRRKSGSYACNTYLATTMVHPASLQLASKLQGNCIKNRVASQDFFRIGGAPINNNQRFITQITGV